jgi:hypothetical protein
MFKLLLVLSLTGAVELEDVPARPAVARERMAVRRLYSRATDKSAAARLLVSRAETVETSLRRYALLVEAKQLASEARDTELVFQIVDTIGRYFSIDLIAMKLSAVKQQRARTATEQRQLLSHVLALADTAGMANDYETVTAALKLARPMAYRLRDRELNKSLTERTARTVVLTREWVKVKDAAEVLEADPGDANANLRLGLFYCVFREEWPRGLQLMAKGAAHIPEVALVLTTGAACTLPRDQRKRDLEMAKIARVDLQRPPGAVSRIRLGDSWLAVSKDYSGAPRSRLLSRAGRWYAQAIAVSTGDARLALERRMGYIEGIEWYGIPGHTIKEHHIFSRRCRSSATRLWANSPGANERQPEPTALPLAYIFTHNVPGERDGHSMTCFNPDNLRTGPKWGTGGWLLDEAAQELRCAYPNKVNRTTPATGDTTKVFSVGLRSGKLYLYNCRENGVETSETALEYGKLQPIDLTR